MLEIVSWLLGSKMGKYVVIGGVVLIALFLLYRSIMAKGAEKERMKALVNTLNNFKTRVKVDEEISSLEPDARREWLREQWAVG